MLRNYFHYKNAGKALFTEKQLQLLDTLYTPTHKPDDRHLQEREVYVRLAYDLPISIGNLMNEAKAHTFLLENYFNQAIITLLANVHNDPHKSLFPDIKSLSITLKQQIPVTWSALRAYDQLMQNLMTILGFEYKEPAELLLMVQEICGKFQVILSRCQQANPKLKRSLKKMMVPNLADIFPNPDILNMLRRRIHLPYAVAGLEALHWWELPVYRLPLRDNQLPDLTVSQKP